jgi:hypothetical protein
MKKNHYIHCPGRDSNSGSLEYKSETLPIYESAPWQICLLYVCKYKYFHCKASSFKKHNRSEMVAVLGPNEALPYYIVHTYIHHRLKTSWLWKMFLLPIIECWLLSGKSRLCLLLLWQLFWMSSVEESTFDYYAKFALYIHIYTVMW